MFVLAGKGRFNVKNVRSPIMTGLCSVNLRKYFKSVGKCQGNDPSDRPITPFLATAAITDNRIVRSRPAEACIDYVKSLCGRSGRLAIRRRPTATHALRYQGTLMTTMRPLPLT